MAPASRVAFGVSFASALAAPAEARAPNVIWLQSDSMDGRLFDPTDDVMYNKLKMSDLRNEWLAKGVTFARHYSNSPQCVPSRTSMMTSRYVHDSHTANNGQGIARSGKTGALDTNCVAAWGRDRCQQFAEKQQISETIVDVVSDMNYDLALFGRFDMGGGIMDDYKKTSGDGFHSGPSLGILARGAALPGTSDGDPWPSTTENAKNPFPQDVKHQQMALEWLNTHKVEESDKPFFLHLGMLCPHPPYKTNNTWLSHVNVAASDVPEQIPREKFHFYDAYMSNSKNAWQEDYTNAQITEMRQAYWGAAAESAVLMLEVMQLAQHTGHLNNTLVILTSDHGEMSLEHRQDYKNSLREPSVRVPLVMIPFGVEGMEASSGQVVKNFTSHLDLMSTLAELGGGQVPTGSRGESLLPFLRNSAPVKPRRDFAAFEYHSNFAPCGSYGLRQGSYKLITFGHHFPWHNTSILPPQLFNLDADPFELNDLAAAHPEIVAAMTATLEAEFGGSGAIDRIEAEQMSDNLANYKSVFHDQCTGDELIAAFLKKFKGATREDVVSRVTAWSGGLDPSKATGSGGHCGGAGAREQELRCDGEREQCRLEPLEPAEVVV